MSSQSLNATDPIFERNEQLFVILVPYLDLSAIFVLCNLAGGDYKHCISRTKRYKNMIDDLDFMIDERRQFLLEAMRKYGIFALDKFCNVVGQCEFGYNGVGIEGDKYFLPVGSLTIIYANPYSAAWFERKIKLNIDSYDLEQEKNLADVLSGRIPAKKYVSRNTIHVFIAVNTITKLPLHDFESQIIKCNSYNLANLIENKTQTNNAILNSLNEYSHENEDFIKLLKNIIPRNLLTADTYHILLCRNDKFGEIFAECGIAPMPPKNISQIMTFLINIEKTCLFDRYFNKDIFIDVFIRHNIELLPLGCRTDITEAMEDAKKYHPDIADELDTCYFRAIIESSNSTQQELEDVFENYDVWRLISKIGIRVSQKHLDFYLRQLRKAE